MAGALLCDRLMLDKVDIALERRHSTMRIMNAISVDSLPG
jgi:hypothetical protein